MGDAWLDWDPSEAREPVEWTSGPGPFVFAATIVSLFLLALWAGLVWLSEPRLLSIGVPAPRLLFGLTGAVILVLPPLLFCASWANLPLPRWLARCAERILVLFWGPATVAARPFGIARDRLGHAFVELANGLSPRARRVRPGDILLVLAPRCLHPKVMAQIKARAAALEARFVVAAGGEEARAAVFCGERVAVLAIACERDLVAGLREVLTRRMVLGLANRRPEGPCCRSEVDLSACDRHLATLQRHLAPLR